MFIDDIKELDTLQMAPGSISQPYFLKDEDKFVIVTFDNVGGSTKEMYSFKKEAMPATAASGDFVTREYFDRKIGDIMEAIMLASESLGRPLCIMGHCMMIY